MPSSVRPALFAALLAGLALLSPGCVATTVAGAAVGVGATAVKTSAKVAGTAVGLTADAAGAAGRTVTGHKAKRRPDEQ